MEGREVPYALSCQGLHQAQLHLFSDFVLCLGNNATNEASGKLTNKWWDNQKHAGTTTSRGIKAKFLDGRNVDAVVDANTEGSFLDGLY